MKNYYKINEISKLYNIGVDSLRYYEEIGILHPMRDHNNYRQYTTSDIYRLNMIRDLRNLGFSMKHIAAYLQHRTIDHSLAFMQEAELAVDKKIEELKRIKQDIKRRKENLQHSQNIPFDTCILHHEKARKCVTLATDVSNDDIQYQFIKLSKEYEDNIYTIGNFHTGCFLSVDDTHTPHPTSVFIMDEDLHDAQFRIPEGDYISLYYTGSRKQNKQKLQTMLNYCQQHNYEVLDCMMEFFIIDVHETTIKDEYITQLQIHIKKR